ncbi:MAG: hypothetical protein ABI880_05695 [Acidobacteriota bacterium]
MTRRWSIASFGLALLAALPVGADVAPFPSWRLAANGSIASAVQAGSAIYLGGSFTKIGRSIAPLAGFLDPATLAFTQATGCARNGDRPVVAQTFTSASNVLADGAGPFPVPAGTRMVRVGLDCRFDRRFRLALPGFTEIDGPDRLIDAGGRIYFSGNHSSAFGAPDAVRVVVELDGETGVVSRYWLVQTPYPMRLEGVTPGGRLLASTRADSGDLVVGWFDPAQGQFQSVRTFPNSGFVKAVGDVIVVSQYLSSVTEVVALDAATLTTLPQWPTVRASFVGAVASGGGRLFLTGNTLTLDDVAAPRLLAFNAATGARYTGWAAPGWINDPASDVAKLLVSGGRLIALGDFASSSLRDTAAAFDAATGALDPWLFPFSASLVEKLGTRIYFAEILARSREGRRGLAAVDATTGALLPWSGADATGTESALAADGPGGFLYAGRSSGVRRWFLSNGAIDPNWQLDLASDSLQPAAPTALALHGGQLYAVGMFDNARSGASGPWQPREAAVAITTGGTLASWRPRLQATCIAFLRIPYPVPCLKDVQVSEGRVVLTGTLQSLDDQWTPARSAMAFASDTAAVDPLLPPAGVGVVGPITSNASGLYAVARLDRSVLAQVTAAAGPRVIGPVGAASSWIQKIAVRDGRLYADVEYDALSGQPTGNPHVWTAPTAVDDGVLDPATSTFQVLGWHAAIAAVAPAAPGNLAAELNGARVTLRWTAGAGDLQPLLPPSAGGTAAIAHLVLASLTSGGPTVAQFDTGSIEPTFSIDAPPGRFYLRVQARNAWGVSAPSAEVRLDVQPLAPEAPLATVASVAGATLRVQWQAPAHGWPATGFRLEAGSSPGGTDLGTIAVAGLEFQTAVPRGRYYVRVRAVNTNGVGPAGDERLLVVP